MCTLGFGNVCVCVKNIKCLRAQTTPLLGNSFYACQFNHLCACHILFVFKVKNRSSEKNEAHHDEDNYNAKPSLTGVLVGAGGLFPFAILKSLKVKGQASLFKSPFGDILSLGSQWTLLLNHLFEAFFVRCEGLLFWLDKIKITCH